MHTREPVLSEAIGSRERSRFSCQHCCEGTPFVSGVFRLLDFKRRIPYLNEKWTYPLADSTQFASVRKTSLPGRLRAARYFS